MDSWQDLINYVAEKGCEWAYVTHTNIFGVTHETECITKDGKIVYYAPDFMEDEDSGILENIKSEIDMFLNEPDKFAFHNDMGFLYTSPTFKLRPIPDINALILR